MRKTWMMLILGGAMAFDATADYVAGDLTLRDAMYLYGQGVDAKGSKMLQGYNCDAFQVVLDISSGYADLTMYSGNNETELAASKAPYPDRIHAAADMFAYALYGASSYKYFRFGDNQNSGSATQVGSGTFFAYCFSTRTDAAIRFREEDTCTIRTSNGSSAPISDCNGTGGSTGSRGSLAALSGVTLSEVNRQSVGGTTFGSSAKLQVSWSTPAYAVDHYVITATESLMNTSVTTTAASGSTSTTIGSLKAATPYSVVVEACADGACNSSGLATAVTATTPAEYWQLQGSGNTVSGLTQPVSDGNARLSATRFGAEAGSNANTVQFYYGPRGVSGMAVASSGVVSAATPSSYLSFTSLANSSGLRSPTSASSGIKSIMTGQGVPLSAAMGGKVRLFFESNDADGKTRIYSVDSVDGYLGRDFNLGSASVCSTSSDYMSTGSCPATLVIGVEGDTTGANTKIAAARQNKLAYPTLSDWRWDGAAGSFMVFTVDQISGCTTATHNHAYAVWDGSRFVVQYAGNGCPKMFISAQAALPMHIGEARYKMYFGDPSVTTGKTSGSTLPFVGPKKLIYADGRSSGTTGTVEFEDWESVASARNVHFLWPNGERLGDAAEGYIDDFHFLTPTGSLDLQVLYLSITDGSVTPFAATAVLLNP